MRFPATGVPNDEDRLAYERLAIERTWQRDPQFYIDQTLGSVFALLLQPPPFTPSRQHEIIERLNERRRGKTGRVQLSPGRKKKGATPPPDD